MILIIIIIINQNSSIYPHIHMYFIKKLIIKTSLILLKQRHFSISIIPLIIKLFYFH